ncbi:MAG: MBL fold metallo-hydrolase [Negativicutes bacterium]|nr:MBL fold metallo-hydrolase [Negativicutes bacterium]
MRIEVIVQGFPGKRLSGSLAWSSVVYVETGKHKILFDTGGPNVRGTVRQHLQKAGVNPEDITMLVLSHFHDDHVRNFDYFPKARIFLHAVEAEWARSDPDEFAYPQHLFPALEKTGRLELVEKDVELVPGVHTLLVPGHTPGSMALVLKEAGRPVTVLGGDAVKNLAELATGKVDKSMDFAVSAQSIKKVRDIGTIIIPGHDRTLQVTDDLIVALTAARETIVVPAGAANPNEPRYLELTLEQTWLPKLAITD